MTNTIEEILKQFPPSSQGNQREIVRKKLEHMRDYPNDRTAKELEALGIPVDFLNSDVEISGPEKPHYDDYEFEDLESTEEHHHTNIY